MIDGISHARLLTFAEKIVGKQDAEDVVQEFYLKFISDKVPPFRNESERTTWLLAVLKYTAYRWRRLRRDAIPNGNGDASYTPNYDDWLDVKKHLLQLKAEHREVLVLYAMHGSRGSVAKALGITRNQVQGRLQRARRRLREQMDA